MLSILKDVGCRVMSFPRFLLSSTLLASTVFSLSVSPLALFGHKTVDIRLGSRTVFMGQLRDLALPYLGVTTAASLGVGMASLALAGWRHSSQKITAFEKQMSELDRQLQEKDSLIEDLAFSEAKLKALGLESFLGKDIASKVDSSYEASHVLI
jgi:hypothetical protein